VAGAPLALLQGDEVQRSNSSWVFTLEYNTPPPLFNV
jgi:hypothetical protein